MLFQLMKDFIGTLFFHIQGKPVVRNLVFYILSLPVLILRAFWMNSDLFTTSIYPQGIMGRKKWKDECESNLEAVR